jgi:hypothetical protein
MGMRKSWNTGLTKETNASVLKISETMRARKLDNFKQWRDKGRADGVIKSAYPALKRTKVLAELIGVILGDGHIGNFPRTECLRIVGHSDNHGFVERYSRIIEYVFGKKPHVAKRSNANAVNITIYEKNLSKRLGIPSGARMHVSLPIPMWILAKKAYKVGYLRGLYEAEGSYNVHQPTYTHKFIFANTNVSLLENVQILLTELGFHPHMSKNKVQISRKEEVQKLKNLLEFRRY